MVIYLRKGGGKMRILIYSVAFFLISLNLSGGVKTEVKGGGPSAENVVTYKGPKARIAVGRFKVKAAKANREIGEGLRDMLIDALFRTNRFIVLEKGESLRELEEEFEFGKEGWTKKPLKKGTFETADIIVVGAITAFEPDYKGSGGGGIFIPLPWKFGGGINIKKKEAYIAATIRLIDVRTRRIIKSVKVEGYASQHKVGIAGGGIPGKIVLGAGFSKYKNTPMEKAVMAMIENAVNEIVKGVPSEYYRYLANGKKKEEEEEIIGGESLFKPGNKVVFEEDFSKYGIGDIPENWDTGDTSVEVAKYKGEKWLRFLSDGKVFYGLDIPENFSLEFKIYLPSSETVASIIFDGSEISIGGEGRKISYNGRVVKKSVDEKINKISFMKKDGIVRIFLNGRKIYQLKIKEEKKREKGLSFSADGIDTEKRRECLITDIKLCGYK